MRTRKIEKCISDDGTEQSNLVFFGVKGITQKNSVTVDGITYPRSIFASYSETNTVQDSAKKNVTDSDGVEVGIPWQSHDSFADGSEGTKQSIIQRLSLIQGELWHYMDQGFPLLEKQSDKQVFDSYIIDVLVNHPDVTQIVSFSSSISSHTYFATFKVDTVYGELTMTESQTV